MNPGVGWRPGMAPQPPAKPDRSVRPGSSGAKPSYAGNGGQSPLSPSHEPPSPTEQQPGSLDSESGHPQWIKSILGPNTVRVPVNTIYLVTAIFILAVVIATVVGYRIATGTSGNNFASRQGLVPPVTEPDDLPGSLSQSPALISESGKVNSGAGSGGGGGSEASRGVPSRTPPKQVPRQEAPKTQPKSAEPAKDSVVLPPPANAVALTSKGWLAADPREEGLNYLKLGEFNQTETENAVRFLAANDLETFAIRVDRGTGPGNNSGPTEIYRLYSARGVSSDEYSKKMTARTNTESTVARLGQRWQKEEKGSSNFSRPGWEKYK